MLGIYALITKGYNQGVVVVKNNNKQIKNIKYIFFKILDQAPMVTLKVVLA